MHSASLVGKIREALILLHMSLVIDLNLKEEEGISQEEGLILHTWTWQSCLVNI
jgi:hypothetical protein